MNVKSTKYLGVLIGEDWHEHIQFIINKLLKFCGLFYKLRVIMPQEVIKKTILCSCASLPCVLCGDLCQYLLKTPGSSDQT